MRIPVLMYHKVRPGKKEKYSISPERFASQMDYLSGKGYQTVSPDELLRFIKGTSNEKREGRAEEQGDKSSIALVDKANARPSSVIKVRRRTLPEKPVLITFDDGYKNNFTCAYPILKRYNFRASIFLVSEYIGKKNGWSKGEEETLSWEEIEEMRKEGFSFGSHTHTHPNSNARSSRSSAVAACVNPPAVTS